MKIYLARHGRTNYNDLDLCNSDPSIDVYITPVGTKQAQTLANKLKVVSLDRIFVSELRRTQQTAEIVNQFHDIGIDVEPLLNDHRSGYEGKPASLLAAMDAAENKWTARFNDGESIEDMKSRVAEFLERLKAEPYDAVLIVTSGWVIRVAVAIIQGISNEEAWTIDAEQGSYLELKLVIRVIIPTGNITLLCAAFRVASVPLGSMVYGCLMLKFTPKSIISVWRKL